MTQASTALLAGVALAMALASGAIAGEERWRDSPPRHQPSPGARPEGYQPPPDVGRRPPPRNPAPSTSRSERYDAPPRDFARPPPPRQNSLGAGWREQQDAARSAVRQGQMLPLGQVIAEIARRSPGRPLDAGIEYRGDRAVYRVRWWTQRGQRVDYIVDAATGQILSEQ